ncbi:hypothetical protein EP073_13285 [Geovibrio thiophilus]|uniref:Uncharacterized protein n=1 Tax=Geovibrio thiophilus TaxID=139438 RepID=A0A3R5Y8N0_9BACT|nr:hypothetical protein [Geovibrio thiophilus]QAR34342.1 hypothetical protein EP073_13285 [Geovibrio thiophilus]
MSEDDNIKYEDFYNISLKNFYEMVTEILHDFHFAVHRSVFDGQGKRRIEIWRSSKDENDNALVWLEVIDGEKDIDPYISTDVLRTMNEENVIKLFFFTNGSLEKKEKEVLDGREHYIFTPTDIMETINALDKKKKYKHQKKRKPKGVPSGYTVLKNYLKNRQTERGLVTVPTSKVTMIAEKYTKMARSILDEVDRMEDINNITPDIRDKFKKIQHDILPEVLKVSVFNFTDKFTDVKTRLFSLLQYLLIYIGAVIEYESEDEMKRSREQVELELQYLEGLETSVDEYKVTLMERAQKIAWKLLYMSIAVIVFFGSFFLLMMNEK